MHEFVVPNILQKNVLQFHISKLNIWMWCSIIQEQQNFSTFTTHALNFFNQVSKIPDVIRASLLVWYSTGNVFLFTHLKQQGFNDFQITNGVSLSPTIFVQRDIVSHIFVLLPPLHSWPFWWKVLSSVVRKKRPVSFMLNISHGLEVLEVFFPIFNNGYVNISFLTTFFIKSYIIALAKALKPAIWSSKFCIA